MMTNIFILIKLIFLLNVIIIIFFLIIFVLYNFYKSNSRCIMKTIIVVEDNAPIRKLFCTLLKKQGLEVIDFGSGDAVLKELPNLKPDLMVLDILLPDINGTELIGKIRAMPHCSNVPAVAVTGFATEQDEIKFKELGFNGYLSKPINTDTFISEIKKHITD